MRVAVARRCRGNWTKRNPSDVAGNLDDVSALAGYVNAASGRTYIAVIMLNHPGVEHGPGEAVQAALVEWLFAQ